MIIKKVLYNKSTGQRYVLVPKNSLINVGDWVSIKKVKKENGGNLCH